METDYRLYILYEMVQSMANHDHVEPLLRDVLEKLLYHSGYSLGTVFLQRETALPAGEIGHDPKEKTYRCRLAMAMGDRNLRKHIGEEFQFSSIPCSLIPASLPVGVLPALFPVKRESYRSFLVLPIPDQGVILLFSQTEGRTEFLDWMQPVMGNLSRAIHFCHLNEQHILEVESDRDTARRKMLRFRRALDATPDYFLLVDSESFRIIDFNQSVEPGLGYGEEEIFAMTLETLFPVEREELENHLRTALETGGQGAPFDSRLRKKNGSCIHASISISLLAEEEGEGPPILILSIRDISLRKKMEEKLSWQAAHDSLTGLFNRRRFETALEESLHIFRERGIPHVILYMDLDQFKIINDISGHMAGDDLLREISSRIQHVLPDASVLARLGGDEFGLILREQSLANAMAIAQRIHHVVDGVTFYWEDKSYRVGISIGLVPFRPDHLSANQLMSIADMACYAAKEGGRNRTHVYDGQDPDFRRHKTEIEWAAELKKAFQEDLFRLHSQSILPLKLSPAHPPHAEVLLRLDSGEGIVLPEQFLPAARKYNLMGEIDRYVIHKVISGLATQNSAGDDGRPIYFINLSSDSVNDSSISGFIQDCLREYRLDPTRIGFEVTESSTIANLGNTIEFISELKYLGIQFALDDFGTGLSSFSYLKKLPLDLIKIDGSFIENIASDPVDRRMVESIHQIGSMLHLRSTAEYVKDAEILRHVRDLGIDYAQGFAVGRPQPLLFP